MVAMQAEHCSTWHDFNHWLSRLDTRPRIRNEAEQPDKSVLHICFRRGILDLAVLTGRRTHTVVSTAKHQ